VKSALPSSLAHQLGTRVLQDRCALLAEAGWTREQVESATRARSWTGAGGGAVVRWITDLATERPPTAADCDRHTTVERQLAARRERQTAIAAAAGSSDLRQEAVRVAAQLAAKSRSRRRMQLGRRSGPDVTPGADVQAGHVQQRKEPLGYGDSNAALASNGAFDSSISSRTNRSQTISELRAGARQ